MDARQVPPPPTRPDFEPPRPRSSWLAIGLAGSAALTMAAILTFLTLGYFAPIVLLALGIFVVIGLQYLVWGWWFERIYREDPESDSDYPPPPSAPAKPASAVQHQWPKPPDIV
jgi:hypothetical protein